MFSLIYIIKQLTMFKFETCASYSAISLMMFALSVIEKNTHLMFKRMSPHTRYYIHQ